ncbi:uncharacterized protein UTRI_02501 [Ustilago trichophora]|uniref:Uncharacterized protein n=1 Tax=Ustilago trichophora TaxID=86804 RepID=A0A5C3E824_9BASI|nr:uncharacterized protein UTRI_02501 [Ustilago trichophora]
MTSSSAIHPVLNLINRCDALAQEFDSQFEQSCNLLRNLVDGNNQSAFGMDETLMSLRTTLEKCEAIVTSMLNCIYEDIPHLLDQLDSGTETGVGNWNPKQALDGISQLFYSYQELLLEKRELLADFTCEEISPTQFVQGWTSIHGDLASQRKQQVDDLADLLAAF